MPTETDWKSPLFADEEAPKVDNRTWQGRCFYCGEDMEIVVSTPSVKVNKLGNGVLAAHEHEDGNRGWYPAHEECLEKRPADAAKAQPWRMTERKE